MISRRDFLKSSSLVGLSAFVQTKTGKLMRIFVQAQGPTDANSIKKYVTPVLIPPAMPQAAAVTGADGKAIDYYEIAVRQFEQQILPAGMPKTTVWGYGPKVAINGPQIFNAPSLTIEAKSKRHTRIKWINELVDSAGNYLPHLLPVDQTIHWANPAGGTAARDSHPVFTEVPGTYTGPVPMVPHVHGAIGVGDESDGYAEAWWLPDAGNIPADYAKVGNWYDFFAAKANQNLGLTWGPGYAIFEYPNDQRASTIWYHDHTMGMTRLNVYTGPAGFFIVRGGLDDIVLDSRNGTKASLPWPAPQLGDVAGTKYYEIPLAIQDRAFNPDGSLFFPDARAFFGDTVASAEGTINDYIPNTDIAPIWNPEFLGNAIIVNGNTWPYLEVEQRRYRLRLLNGCDARTLILKFEDKGAKVWMIGNEAGFLEAPVNMNETKLYADETLDGTARLLMGNAERADIIVDFSGVPAGKTFRLLNIGPDSPFGGLPFDREELSNPNTTGQVMEFRVVKATGVDYSTPPEFLKLPVIAPLPEAVNTRKLCLVELNSPFFGEVPVEARLGTVDTAGKFAAKKFGEPLTENPQAGDTEIWEFYNTTMDAHPMHVHEVAFEVVNRQKINIRDHNHDEGTGVVSVDPLDVARPPEPWERGRKDTVLALPGEVTRIKATFTSPGQFVWHCHIVDHEDNEMMRPYRIGPKQPNEPTPRM